MKILVADDSGVMRKIIIRELAILGYNEAEHVKQAEDGAEAVKAATTEAFDIILMDWNMPNMLGIDAVRAIRAAGVKTPILMITTESERSNVVAAIQAGANNYLAKPFTKEDFSLKFNQCVGAT